jgi:hypothetical protein
VDKSANVERAIVHLLFDNPNRLVSRFSANARNIRQNPTQFCALSSAPFTENCSANAVCRSAIRLSFAPPEWDPFGGAKL